MQVRFELTSDPDERELASIGDGLDAFNDEDSGPSGKKTLVVFVRDEAGRIQGGLYGWTGWGWLFTDWLWLAEPLRGQGLAGKLLDLAEDEARTRGCHGAYIDTFNPVAERLYKRQGYEAFGTLPNFPPGRERVFLRKML
jgi:GNAT superfamily N-acetyltransferase